ncbi:MAG: ATP-NAD kinase family protein [Promethearchaeota archaeon]
MDTEKTRFRIGLIINPIAGVGGKIGYKGSDGIEAEKAIEELGAEIQSPRRTREFLQALVPLQHEIHFITVAGVMGGNILQEFPYTYELLSDQPLLDLTELFSTTSEHTKAAARAFLNNQTDLLIFVGGDGTARDICEVIQNGGSVNAPVPVLGIPSGVKIHSSVFSTTPSAAAQIVIRFLHHEIPLREAEVLDIDEEKFRDNQVISKLYGYMRTPYAPTLSQPSKMASPHTEQEFENQTRIAEWLLIEWDRADPDIYYLLGPGTTTRAIANVLEQPKSLLGVDLFYQKQQIAADLNEHSLLDYISGKSVKLIITPIGAQGFVFGRGNLQLSAKVLSHIGLSNIQIIATKYKVSTLPNRKLRIDSRDSEFDVSFQGLHRVLVDFGEYQILEVI